MYLSEILILDGPGNYHSKMNMYGKSSKKRYFLKKTGNKSLGIKQLYILVFDIIHFGKFLPGDQKICSI